MKFSNKELLIFDLDGTLIDSVPDLAVAVNHMLAALERPQFNESTIRGWVGNGAAMLVKRALSGNTTIDKTLDAPLYAKALDTFMNFYGENLWSTTKAYPKVKETLETLSESGYRLAIVTNKPYDFVEPILSHLAIDHLFEYWIGGDSLTEKKPHPMPLLHVCRKLDVPVEASLMIGDSKNDIYSAQASDMHVVGVSYGYNYEQDIAAFHPDTVIDHFEELLKILERKP